MKTSELSVVMPGWGGDWRKTRVHGLMNHVHMLGDPADLETIVATVTVK